MKNHNHSPLAGVGAIIGECVDFIGECADAAIDGLQETSRGVSRGVEKGVEKVVEAVFDRNKTTTDTTARKSPRRKAAPKAQAKKPAPRPRTKKNPSPNSQKAPVLQAPAELPDKAWLLKQARDAIHRTYHMEGGFRFFAGNFCRHVRVVLPRQTDVEEIFVDTYNSCLQPMLRHLRKLEKTLAGLKAQWGEGPMEPENQALLDAMTGFAAQVEAERLNTPEGWDLEGCRAALTRCAADLQRLLDTWPEPEE